MQRAADEANCVFSFSENPDQLWINLGDSGEYPIPPYSWIIRHANGEMSVSDAQAFESFTKVVPLPAPVIHPPADGVPDKPKLESVKAPAPTTENIAGDITEMRNEMLSAIKMLQEDDPESVQAALDYLKSAVSMRTRWCNCIPGKCQGGGEAGCRESSPLLK